jgi:8-oxo-dGTP pyrophosphatase MutT (NUDIX family)
MSTFQKFLYSVYKARWAVTRPITLGVRLMLVKDDQILLVKTTYQEGWYFPGGGVKRNETLEQAARREAKEEIGAQLGRLELLGIFALFADFKSDHIALFKCNDFSYTGKHDFEIEQISLFPLDRLPAGMAAGHQRRIEEYLIEKTEGNYGLW